MKFDGKVYCYYTLINLIKMDERKSSQVLDLLGNFKIEPGSLKETKRNVKYISSGIPALVSDLVDLENSDFICHSLLIDEIGGIEIEGNYGGNPTRLIVDVGDRDSELNLVIVASDGIHYFATRVFNDYTYHYQPYYVFYDSETFGMLQNNFGLEQKEIMKLTPEELHQLGFSPDDCFFAKIEELGYDSKSEFISSLLQKMNCSTFFKTIANVNRNDNLVERHI